MRTVLAAVLAAVAVLPPQLAWPAPLNVVVAQNAWSDAVYTIGGANVAVHEILANPLTDPHEFEPAPSSARAVADADIVIYNGLGYDAWMDRLLAASTPAKRIVINVAMLLPRRPGDNPHLWYDPSAMPALTDAIVKALSAADPGSAAAFAARGEGYRIELAAVAERVAAVRARHAGAPVTATEPVFGHMAQALGLAMRNQGFQNAIMNETEPSPRDLVAMEGDLREGKVRVLFYNSQVTDAQTERLLGLAEAANVPVVGVTETKPAGRTYIEWMISQIDATERALAGGGV